MYKFSFCTEYADERDLGLELGTFTEEGQWENYCAKQCALIAVDEILKCDPLSPSELTGEKTSIESYKRWEHEAYQYWEQVKQEIEKL